MIIQIYFKDLYNNVNNSQSVCYLKIMEHVFLTKSSRFVTVTKVMLHVIPINVTMHDQVSFYNYSGVTHKYGCHVKAYDDTPFYYSNRETRCNIIQIKERKKRKRLIYISKSSRRIICRMLNLNCNPYKRDSDFYSPRVLWIRLCN